MRRGSQAGSTVLIGTLLLLPACGTAGRTAIPALHRLDARHATEFQRAFEQAVDRPRYVVALSPT